MFLLRAFQVLLCKPLGPWLFPVPCFVDLVLGLPVVALALALDITTACSAEPFTEFPTMVGMMIDFDVVFDDVGSEGTRFFVLGCVF